MKYELACGDTGNAPLDNIRETMLCVAHGPSKVKAIETREYHVTCQNCRYGRWVGQSQEEASRLADRHNNRYPNHRPNVDYQRYPTGRDIVIQRFGPRRVRTVIETNRESIPGKGNRNAVMT